jgi:mono/diheme cytochrome c family protein
MAARRRSGVRTAGARAGVGVALALALAATGCGGGGSGGASTTTKAPANPGQALFTSVGCSSCHTLAAAGAHGQVGPNLDTLKPTRARVAKQVTNGGGGMPPFRGQLSSAQIQQVAAYVAKVAGR